MDYENLKKERNNLNIKIFDLKEKLRSICKEAEKYNDIKKDNRSIIEGINEAKKLLNDFSGIYKIRIDKENNSCINAFNFKIYTIDFKKVVELIKNNKKEELGMYLDNIYNLILNGYNIIFENNIESKEEIYVLYEFINTIINKLPDIEKTLEKNISIAIKYNKELYEFVSLINNNSLVILRESDDLLSTEEYIEKEKKLKKIGK